MFSSAKAERLFVRCSWALVNHLMDTKREFPGKVEERIAVEMRVA